MCAINPKHKRFFTLEFYSSHGTKKTFEELLVERLCWMEQAFNASGGIRVHINETRSPDDILTDAYDEGYVANREDDTIKFCPECERANQFGELCHSCRQQLMEEV